MEKETRVYVINTNDDRVVDIEWINELSDDEFIYEAEKQGRVYSLKGFEKAFSNEEINTSTDEIRFINMNLNK
jgi:cellobiose phosphorylase